MLVTSLTISLRGSLLIPSLRYSFSSEVGIVSTILLIKIVYLEITETISALSCQKSVRPLVIRASIFKPPIPKIS